MNHREKQQLGNAASDWVSRKWHSTHSWKSKTGKFIKRLMHKSIRHNKDFE